MVETKITKQDWYAQIKAVIEDSDSEQKEDIINFIDHEVELLETKAAKAAERAASKKAAGDALRASVYAVLTNEPQTIDEIAFQVVEEGVTKAMITARLTQLVKTGAVEKGSVRVDGRKLATYVIVDTDTDTDTDTNVEQE